MPEKQKLCFVIMGFGKKTEQTTGTTLDLDKTYKNIIKPAVQKAGLQCIRADEIQDSSLIDKSMYALLMHADLVIADISTYNPNAIYELGIRHGVRPFSTIIIKEESGNIPFDLDHTRIFKYTHLGEDIGADEARRCQQELECLIQSVLEKKITDSPLYDFIRDIEPPKISTEEYNRIIGDLLDKEKHVFAISERASHYMDTGRFNDAATLWHRASKMLPNEPYYVQQHALARYKSRHPNEINSLNEALHIIQKLTPNGDSNDPETLGLTGAIYKRMWLSTEDETFLRRAAECYGKSFQIRGDYYGGENYALCQDMLAHRCSGDERIFFRISARKTRERIIELLRDYLLPDKQPSTEQRWVYASLANCFFGLGKIADGQKFEMIFLQLSKVEWEKESYFSTKKKLHQLLVE